MRRACVIGWPVEHSRSPLIHGYWLEQYGIDGAYEKQAVRPEALARFLGSLGAQGYAGANVTLPHKEAALKLAAVADEAARAIGAANTLWLDQSGRLCASNTDAYGFITNLNEAGAWLERGTPAGDGAWRRWRGAGDPARSFGRRRHAHFPRQPHARPRRGSGAGLWACDQGDRLGATAKLRCPAAACSSTRPAWA